MESWRARPVAAVVAVVVLLVAVAALVVQRRSAGDERDRLGALREWASGQHGDLDPPAGIVLPDVSCDGDPYDLVAVRGCLREAHRSGTPASGHLRADMSYPDALDLWITVAADRHATIVERVLTVPRRPDVEGTGEIHPWELTTTSVSWRTWTCERVSFSDEVDLYPGVECEDADEGPALPPEFEESEVRELTEAERQELVRAFACTHPQELGEYGC